MPSNIDSPRFGKLGRGSVCRHQRFEHEPMHRKNGDFRGRTRTRVLDDCSRLFYTIDIDRRRGWKLASGRRKDAQQVGGMTCGLKDLLSVYTYRKFPGRDAIIIRCVRFVQRSTELTELLADWYVRMDRCGYSNDTWIYRQRDKYFYQNCR